MTQAVQNRERERQSWPFARTPVAIYLTVMGPICALMLLLIFVSAPMWMKVSASLVIVLTGIGYCKNYVRRLVLTPRSARFIRLGKSIEIPWSKVRRAESYVPGGGVGATSYVYITSRESPPEGKWDLDAQTIQLQDRPGLLDSIHEMQSRATNAGHGLPL